MYCPNCGTLNDNNAYRCVKCQSVIQIPSVAPAANTDSLDKLLKYVIPINRTGWSITAGYVGLFSILLFPAPVALALGLIAYFDLKKKPGKSGKGRAIFAIIAGSLGTIGLIYFLLTGFNFF